jgi:hypothetical protein
MMLDAALEALASAKQDLSDDARRAILDAGNAAVPGLLRALVSPELRNPDGPAEGWPPVHAVDCLVDLREERALAALLESLVESDGDELVHERLLDRLPDYGDALVEPALAVAAELDDPETVDALATVLANAGVHDDRIWELLVEVFEDEPAFGATLFADYGDPRALPLVKGALDRFDPDPAHPLARLDLEEMIEAYEDLGGTIDAATRERFDAFRGPMSGPSAQGAGSENGSAVLDALGADDEPAGENGVLEQQILEFGQPLLEVAEGEEATKRAVELVLLCWDLAMTGDEAAREQGIEEAVCGIPDTEQQEEARGIVRAMIERHRRMYPGMHADA